MIDEIVDKMKMVDKRFGEGPHEEALRKIVEFHDAPEEFAEQLVTFSSVLKTGRYKAEAYLKAVQYCSHRQMNMSMIASYRKTHPDRCFRNGEKKPEGTIQALASLYDKTAIVQGILSQMQIPLHIMMMAERVKAANVLASLMVHSDNERIQMESADKLLNHIAVPETMKVELDIGIKTDDTLTELNEKLTALANMAQTKILNKMVTPLDVIEL